MENSREDYDRKYKEGSLAWATGNWDRDKETYLEVESLEKGMEDCPLTVEELIVEDDFYYDEDDGWVLGI